MHLLPADIEKIMQDYMHFSIFDRDLLNRKVLNEKGIKVKCEIVKVYRYVK